MKLTGEVKRIDRKTCHILTNEGRVKVKSASYFNSIEKGDTVQFEGDLRGDVFYVVGYELQGLNKIALLLPQLNGISPLVADEIKLSLGAKANNLFKHPELIYEVKNLSDNMKDHIFGELKHLFQRAGFVNLSGYLQKYNIDIGTIYKIFAHFDFSLNAAERIKNNPYILVLVDTSSAWFNKLDEMANDMGKYSATSDTRRFAKIISILLSEEKHGHCYIRWQVLTGRLISAMKDLHYKYTAEDARQDIKNMLLCSKEKRDIPDEFYIYALKSTDNGKPYTMVYRQRVFFSEKNSAQFISVNAKETVPPPGLDTWLEKRQTENGKPETKEQISAVKMFWNNSISILTGGPGTGKTHTIGAILSSVRDLAPDRLKVLTAPTGRASRRMEEMLGHKAQTVHSLVGGLHQNHFRKIDADIVIVDETSMLDIMVLDALLRSLKDGARILFVGDPNQLPSVQPGNVLLDMLRAGVPSTGLTVKNFRSTGSIVKNAYSILSGNTDLVYDNRFQIITAEMATDAIEIIKKEAQAPGVQVLTSRRDGADLSAEKLNSLLRPIINPGLAAPEKNFRRNDRIICIRNNWDKDKNVCNGEIGIVVDVDRDSKGNIKKIITKFNGGGPVVWSWIEANIYLEFAYAITVHKAQGSEYDTVIIPVAEDDDFMDASLFYTAVTRAKDKVLLVGQKKRIEQILLKKPRARHTNLSVIIKAYKDKKAVRLPLLQVRDLDASQLQVSV